MRDTSDEDARIRQGAMLRHKTGGLVILHHRKADDSGWWNTDKSGLSDDVLREGLADGTWTFADPPEQAERPDISYVTGHSVAEALHALARRFECDDDLVLIGLWNIEPPESEGYPEAYLQVVTTSLDSATSGGSGS